MSAGDAPPPIAAWLSARGLAPRPLGHAAVAALLPQRPPLLLHVKSRGRPLLPPHLKKGRRATRSW